MCFGKKTQRFWNAKKRKHEHWQSTVSDPIKIKGILKNTKGKCQH